MFWGLNLKPNRKYSQTSQKSFHISQAALDSESSEGGPTQIFISSENQRFLICTLRKDVCEQMMLDLNFGSGNEICFQSIGSGNVALSGYLIDDELDYMNGDKEEEVEEEVDDSEAESIEMDLRNTLNAKKAQKNEKSEKSKPVLKASATNDDEDDDDSDSDSDAENAKDVDDDDLDSDENEEGDDDEEHDVEEQEEEDDSDAEEVEQPKTKHPKLDIKPEKQQNGVGKQKEQPTAKMTKKEKKLKQQQLQQQQQNKQKLEKQQKTGAERSLSGGVKVVDMRVGNGPEAKVGKRAQVYYEGRLLSCNKVFDSLKTGAGFKFSLGRGEVIKGWDVGVVGMKVGGKRRITCPAHMAYGSRGSPPAIPPNSTLVFEVELKGVN